MVKYSTKLYQNLFTSHPKKKEQLKTMKKSKKYIMVSGCFWLNPIKNPLKSLTTNLNPACFVHVRVHVKPCWPTPRPHGAPVEWHARPGRQGPHPSLSSAGMGAIWVLVDGQSMLSLNPYKYGIYMGYRYMILYPIYPIYHIYPIYKPEWDI